MKFVKAQRKNVAHLRHIAFHSEKHWGYSDSFMRVFDEKFNITTEFIETHPTFVGVIDDTPKCFWGITLSEDNCELEYFYVDENVLGHGYGKTMWLYMLNWCRENKIERISFVTSPQAVGFYEKMGAVVSGEALSTIDGRVIPRLTYII